ncbi:unnamed protein product, partial [Staurois parvus]
DSSGHGWSVHTAGTVQYTGGRCTQRGQFRTQVVSAHNRDSSGQGWSVHTVGTVQNTGGQCAQQGQFRTLTVSSLQTLSGRRLQTGRTSSRRSRDNQQSADSSSSPGTQQRMASRDTQPWTVCGVPKQQLPGHSATDSFQGHAATDSVQGPSAAAPRAFSSRQGARVLSRQAYRLAGSGRVSAVGSDL